MAAPAFSTNADVWNVCVDFGTAFCKAAAAPSLTSGAVDPSLVRPLSIGAGLVGENPLLLESSVFIADGVVLFGALATAEAAARASEKRQALRSFKTLLGSRELAIALEAPLPASIDPQRRFRQRDLIVLFMARLLRAIGAAIEQDPKLKGGEFRMRYALPAWSGALSSHSQIKALFHQASAVQDKLGDALRDERGVPVEAARAALDATAGLSGDAPEMGMVFEATAAAYSAVGASNGNRFISIVDMGAGTTDFAALGEKQGAIYEISEARGTMTKAGDLVDRILLDLALEKFPELKKRSERAELWRSLMGSIRETKESLFVEGRAALTFRGRVVVISLRELTGDRDFKVFLRELRRGFDQSLTAAADHAVRAGCKEVTIVALGGGAGAPFIQDMLRKAKASKVRARAVSATPDWAHAPVFRNNLAPLFPQLAIAIGGALAPDHLLAAR